MDQCPLCESFVLVAADKPCYLCGLSLIEIANDKMVAVVPGWFFFDPAKPRCAKPALRGLLRTTENVILDLSEVRFLSSAGIEVLTALNAAIKLTGPALVLANVGPHVTEVLRTSRLSRIFRIVEDIEEGLDSF